VERLFLNRRSARFSSLASLAPRDCRQLARALAAPPPQSPRHDAVHCTPGGKQICSPIAQDAREEQPAVR